MIMASDYNSAGLQVGHNIHTLRSVILDLVSGFRNNPHERRHISADKQELRNARDDLSLILEEIERADTSQVVVPLRKLDPRDPDPSRPGIFRDHNCWRCRDGKLPCAQGHPNRCGNPIARND
jgi:heat shock protein HspQ